jgi:NAD(P)-dependent dehydrogenase (short-subunit alcohol dehydrogenase family)/acyl carrier protein
VRYFEDGALKPLPLRLFPISEVETAYRHMAQAKHIGKIVLSLEDQEVMIAPSLDAPLTFRSDGTYLITGGLGGLGLTLARWMVEHGARHLMLMGRSGASAAAQETLDAMDVAGAQITVARADVTDAEQVADVLANIDQSMPPLRGVFHTAAVLDDGILLQLNRERFKTVMAPKVRGAWNLHSLTLDKPLDFFVLYSSGASLLGSPGQASYVAANAFLDALAYYRRSQGLPALTINWGAWAEVGLAARADRSKHLTYQGIIPFTPEQGMALMGRLLQQDAPQVMANQVDWSRLVDALPAGRRSGFFVRFAAEHGPSGQAAQEDSGIREALWAVEPGPRRRALLEAHLQEQVAHVLRLPAARIGLTRPLDAYGLDSLMAVELKNRMESSLGVMLSSTVVWNYPTISALATHVAQKAQIPLEAAMEATLASGGTMSVVPAAEDELTKLLDDLEQLSDEEVRRLLAEPESKSSSLRINPQAKS